MPDVILHQQHWFYATWGEPKNPAIILLHGFTGSHASWNRLAPRLAQDYFVVAPDLPGHGQTQTPDDPHDLSIDATARQLSHLLDTLSLSRIAVLGYSMGGRLALHWAIRESERFFAVVLESASAGLKDPNERQARRARDGELADAIESQGIGWFVPYWATIPLFSSQSPRVVQAENRIRFKQSAHGLATSLRGAGTGEQDSLWERLGELSMPTLFVTGALDQKFTALAQAMAHLTPHGTHSVIPQAGHAVHAEQPDRFYERLITYLQSV